MNINRTNSLTCQLLILFLILSFFTLEAQDGIYLEQNIQSSGINLPKPLNSLTKFWITEKNVRIEQPGQLMVLDFDEEKIFTIMPDNKEYLEMTFKDMEGLLAFSNMFMQGTTDEVTFLLSDSTKKINTWDAYKIEAKSEKRSFEVWLCEDIQIDRSVIFKMYSKMPGMSALVSALEKGLKYKGFPVLINMEIKMMDALMTTKVELIKVVRQKIDKNLFSIPKDYKQIEDPFKKSSK